MLVRISSAIFVPMALDDRYSVDRVANRHFEFSYAAGYTASDLLFCKGGEPTFDAINPGESSGREEKPSLDVRGFMRSIVGAEPALGPT